VIHKGLKGEFSTTAFGLSGIVRLSEEKSPGGC